MVQIGTNLGLFCIILIILDNFTLFRNQEKLGNPSFSWRPVRDSNPCYRRERAIINN